MGVQVYPNRGGLVTLTIPVVEKIILHAMKEPFWRVSFQSHEHERSGKRNFQISDAGRRESRDQEVLFAVVEVEDYIWTHPDPIEQRAVIYRTALQIRHELSAYYDAHPEVQI